MTGYVRIVTVDGEEFPRVTDPDFAAARAADLVISRSGVVLKDRYARAGRTATREELLQAERERDDG